MKAALISAFAVLFLTGAAFGQIVVEGDVTKATMSPNREDVKSIGMGRTAIANGHSFNGMMYNPALLSRTRTSFDIANIGVELSTQTFDALAFLRDNVDQFRTGQFIKDIRNGVRLIQQGGDLTTGIKQINQGLDFTRQFQDKVLGTVDDPKTHAVVVIPTVQVQVGNWGFALSGILQAGFQAFPSEALTRLYSLRLSENLENISPRDVLDLLSIVDPLIDPVTGDLAYKGAIPTTYAIATMDIVGAVGYAREIQKDLHVGANLKVVNRRFSNKIISSENYSNIFSELRKDFAASVTGVTLDLGGLYRFQRSGAEIGLSLQNVIPVSKVSSTATFATVVYDNLGNPRRVDVKLPFDLTMPFLVNAGVNYPITSNWDASFDWVDIAAQDEGYEKYIERFRLGTEYRLEAVRDAFGIAFRAGLANKRATGGVGFNIFRVVQLDGAIAYSNLVGDYAYYAQLKLGW